MSRSLVLSGIVVSLGLLLGRLMGFVREVAMAATFGVSSDADVAVLALTIPDVLVGLLVAGGLSAALIPEFKSLTEQQKRILFMQVSLATLLLFSALVFCLSFFVGGLVYVFAPGLSQAAANSAEEVMSLVLWLIPLTVLAGVTTAYLQAKEKFAMPAMGTFIFNACVVFGLIFFAGETKNLIILAYFILLGGVLRWLSQLLILRRDVVWASVFKVSLVHKALFWRYTQAVMALGLLTLFPVVARAFASLSGEGGLAMMNYAWRLIELPLGLVITVLAVVLFPKLSEMYAQNDEGGFVRFLHEGLTWSLLLATAIVGPMLASPETFVGVVYGWGGSISSEKISTISLLLQLGVMILPFQAVIAMSVAAFNARKNTKLPMKVSTVGFSLLIPTCYCAQNYFGLPGVILAILSCYAGVSVTLLYELKREHSRLLLPSLLATPVVMVSVTFCLSLLILTFSLPELVNLILFLLVMVSAISLVLVHKGGISYIRNLRTKVEVN